MTTELKRILIRRGSTAQWTANNAVLSLGELGLDTTTGRLRMGDGVTAFLSLPIVDLEPFPTIAEMLADNRAFADGVNLMAGGYPYVTVSASPHLTLAGGQKVQHVAVNNVYHMLALGPNADGATDDKALIDKLNVSGFVLDLGGKSYEYGGVWAAAATVINGSIIDDNRTWDYRHRTYETTQATPLTAIPPFQYETSVAHRIYLPDRLVMTGMRLRGVNEFSEGVVKKTGVTDGSKLVYSNTDIWGLNTYQTNTPYGRWGCANDDDDEMQILCVPFFKVLSSSGDTINLAKGGFPYRIDNLEAATYDMDTAAIAGADAIIIGEGGLGARWSGRRARIKSATNSSITFEPGEIGALQAGNNILPVPKFDHVVYLGAHTKESGPPKNGTMTGGGVVWCDIRSLDSPDPIGSAVNVLPKTGAVTSWQTIEMASYVPPTATAAIIDMELWYGGESDGSGGWNPGTIAEEIGTDTGSHICFRHFENQPGIETATSYHSQVQIPFVNSSQTSAYKTGGSDASRMYNRAWRFRGWVEP